MTQAVNPQLSIKELSDLLYENSYLLNAVRHHFKELFHRLTDIKWAAIVCDKNGFVFDILGNPGYRLQMQQTGITLGVQVTDSLFGRGVIGEAMNSRRTVIEHAQEFNGFTEQVWSIIASPILINEHQECIGVLAFVVPKNKMPDAVVTLLHSTIVGITSRYQFEDYNQNMSLIHHSVLSQLECHLISIDSKLQVMEERHPLPLPSSSCEAMRLITQQGESTDSELTINGRTYLVDVRHIRDHTGTVKYTLGLFRDVTSRKEYELRLRDVEKLSTLTSLTAGIAHEIRNPLTTAKGFLQLFSERSNSSQDKQFINLTITELTRIQTLLQDFMSIARPYQTVNEEVNIVNTLHEVIQFLIPEARLKNVEIECDLPCEEVIINTNVSQMKQVMINIVQNAVQACINHGLVHITLISAETNVQIKVSDTGCGIADVSQLFRPFFTTKQSGTGLGLLVTKNILEEHNGTIDIESTVGKGTTVTITLPKEA